VLARAGGVQLQFLGIGRNGHVAFNELGTRFALGFHFATLAAATRDDARARFLNRRATAKGPTAALASIASGSAVPIKRTLAVPPGERDRAEIPRRVGGELARLAEELGLAGSGGADPGISHGQTQSSCPTGSRFALAFALATHSNQSRQSPCPSSLS